jgi:hypothetical protein
MAVGAGGSVLVSRDLRRALAPARPFAILSATSGSPGV